MGMPGQGVRSFDIIRQILGSVVNIFNKRPYVCTAPCDGRVLRMHYQWMFWTLLGGFSAVWYSWFHRDVITCTAHFNAETQVRLDYINVCLSYPYLEGPGGKRYLLFYRWTHWALLVLAMIYYIPRKLAKTSENPKMKKLLEDIAAAGSRYDLQYEREFVDRVIRYMTINTRTHNGLFYKYLFCNFIALFIDIFALHFLDFVLQGRFIGYGFNTYPFTREVVNYTDPMSQAFPPFADCELNVVHELVNKRAEKFGCHLTVMELYEKYFLIVWCSLFVLILCTIVYIIYLFFMYTKFVRLLVLRVAKPRNSKDKVRHMIVKAIKDCRIGDVYFLYRLRQFFSHARYYELLTKLSDASRDATTLTGINVDTSPQRGGGQDVRARKGSIKHPKLQDSLPSERRYPESSVLIE